MNKNSDEDENFNKAEVNREDGLNVSYDKDELNQFLPHLMDEIQNKEKAIQIDSVNYDVEDSEKEEEKEDEKNKCLDNLSDPKAVDFIRRCSTKKEAMEIIDFLLERGELSKKQYVDIKDKIQKKEGLITFIKNSGGYKEPGYYMRKYYYNQDFDKKKKDKK